MEVIQNDAISLTSGPREDSPYLPIVKAMAPKAPTGANRITISTMRNTTLPSDSSKSTRGFAYVPAAEIAKPNRIETRTTSRMSPLAKASTMVVGMIWIRKSVTVCALACPA